MTRGRRLLIVKLTALGDVMHALPVLAYLRDVAPATEIHWAVDERFADVLSGCPDIARVVPIPREDWGRLGSPAMWRTAASATALLRGGRYDLAVDLQGNFKSGVVTALSGAPLRYGFPREAAQEGANAWFTNRRPAIATEGGHVSQRLLRLVSAALQRDPPVGEPRGGLSFTAAEEARLEALLTEALPAGTPRLALHPGTTWSSKRMDAAFWAATVRTLRASFPRLATFLSWGTEREREACVAVRALAGDGVVLLPRLACRPLAAAYRACGHVVGPDTGPLHLAAAAGAKTVSVFRGTDGRVLAPPGPGHVFLQAPPPCAGCRRACPRDAACRASIDPADVAGAMADLMRPGHHART